MRAYLDVNAREAIEALGAVAERGRAPEPALRSAETLQDLLQGERRIFGGTGGFPRSTASWAREKRRRGLDARSGRATGKVERSLTQSGAGLTFSAFNGTLRFGIPRGRSDIYYAAILADRRRKRRWRFVRVDAETKANISLRVQRYVATGVL